jgi:hypothetical protein
MSFFCAANDAQSKHLLKVTLNFVTNTDCVKYYKYDIGGRQIPEGISDDQLCSGVLEGGKDTCQVRCDIITLR